MRLPGSPLGGFGDRRRERRSTLPDHSEFLVGILDRRSLRTVPNVLATMRRESRAAQALKRMSKHT